MNIIEQIVSAILKWLVWLAKTPYTAEDAKPDPELKKKLLDRIADSDRKLLNKSGDGAPR